MSGTDSAKVLAFVQQALAVCALGFVIAGGTFALTGSRGHGFTLIAVGVLFALVVLLFRLYRSRYRL